MGQDSSSASSRSRIYEHIDPHLSVLTRRVRLAHSYFPQRERPKCARSSKKVVSANDHVSAGHSMVMNNPSTGRVLMVAPEYFGTGPEPQATFKPLIDLEPLHKSFQSTTFEKHSDHLSGMCVKGYFVRFSHTGLYHCHLLIRRTLVSSWTFTENCSRRYRELSAQPSPSNGIRRHPVKEQGRPRHRLASKTLIYGCESTLEATSPQKSVDLLKLPQLFELQ